MKEPPRLTEVKQGGSFVVSKSEGSVAVAAVVPVDRPQDEAGGAPADNDTDGYEPEDPGPGDGVHFAFITSSYGPVRPGDEPPQRPVGVEADRGAYPERDGEPGTAHVTCRRPGRCAFPRRGCRAGRRRSPRRSSGTARRRWPPRTRRR